MSKHLDRFAFLERVSEFFSYFVVVACNDDIYILFLLLFFDLTPKQHNKTAEPKANEYSTSHFHR